MRTIYRRTLLIAPWINPYAEIARRQHRRWCQPTAVAVQGRARPGADAAGSISLEQAIAAIIAFQDRYDLSVRLEWDHSMCTAVEDHGQYAGRPDESAKIALGILAYLREPARTPAKRIFPYPLVSLGSGYQGPTQNVEFLTDPEIQPPTDPPRVTATEEPRSTRLPALSFIYHRPVESTTSHYCLVIRSARLHLRSSAGRGRARHLQRDPQRRGPGGARGPRPGAAVGQPARRRRDDDRALAFDIRVYDPGAPLFGYRHGQDQYDPCWSQRRRLARRADQYTSARRLFA